MDKQSKICLEKRNLLLRGFILCWEKSQISKFFCSKSRLRNIWLLEPSCGGQKCFPNQSYTLLSHRDTDTCLHRKNFYTVKAVQFQFDSVSEVSLNRHLYLLSALALSHGEILIDFTKSVRIKLFFQKYVLWANRDQT